MRLGRGVAGVRMRMGRPARITNLTDRVLGTDVVLAVVVVSVEGFGEGDVAC